MAELPNDGTSPHNWPIAIGPFALTPQADPGVRALLAAQLICQHYGDLIRHLRGPKPQLVRLWAVTRARRIEELLENAPPSGITAFPLWLLQNPGGGVTLLFASEFNDLPREYHAR